MMKRCFPDVNVWFALAVADHPHHRAALAWWNEDASLAGFSRLTQLGLVRLLTTASAMGGSPLTNEEAWGVYDGFLSDDRVQVFPELTAFDDLFRSLSSVQQACPKIWVDTYLAAHAAANEAMLVTFDQAFTNYGVECRILALNAS
jgi:toxin-antitoxin system PIN domain toxin